MSHPFRFLQLKGITRFLYAICTSIFLTLESKFLCRLLSFCLRPEDSTLKIVKSDFIGICVNKNRKSEKLQTVKKKMIAIMFKSSGIKQSHWSHCLKLLYLLKTQPNSRMDYLLNTKLKLFEHPFNTPDLAPYNFAMFSHVKMKLKRRRFPVMRTF